MITCHAFVCFQPVVGQDCSLTRLSRGFFLFIALSTLDRANTDVFLKCLGWWQQFRISLGPLLSQYKLVNTSQIKVEK